MKKYLYVLWFEDENRKEMSKYFDKFEKARNAAFWLIDSAKHISISAYAKKKGDSQYYFQDSMNIKTFYEYREDFPDWI